MSSVIRQFKRMAVALSALTLLWPVVAAAEDGQELIDYQLLNHHVRIKAIRAGNHDASGENQYLFRAEMFGLANSVEERDLPFDERKKVPVELGTFGDVKIKALDQIEVSAKEDQGFWLAITGDQVRQLVSQSMRELELKEEQIYIQVRITLVAVHTKYFVLTEEHAIASADYQPIPATKFDVPPRVNQDLMIQDELGTRVQLMVDYEDPVKSRRAPTATTSDNG